MYTLDQVLAFGLVSLMFGGFAAVVVLVLLWTLVPWRTLRKALVRDGRLPAREDS